MLDENEFKPFTLKDFSVADAASEDIESISTPTENLAISDQIESFKPLTFEEEVSEDFISKESNGFQEVKTDAEKIQLSEDFKNSEFFLENSLLTDAEEFAETIRKGAKLHKAQLLKQIEEQVNKILKQLDSLRKVVRFQAEEELVKLALQISKNIVAEEIKLNQDVIKNIVQAALHESEVQGKIYLYLHPDD